MDPPEEAPLIQLRRAESATTVSAWWQSKSRDVLSLLTVLLLLGIGLGIWVYGTLPTSDQDEHPHEYALSTDRIREHLTKFLDIAEKHNNSRSVTNGHAASAEYVIAQLQAHGDCDVHVQHFVSPVWKVNKEPKLSVGGSVGTEYIFETDFQVMRYGGQGATIKRAPVAVVDNGGCIVEDADNVSGKVAIVHPSKKCTIFEAAFLLEQMGAHAVVFVRSSRYKYPSRARVRITDWKEGDPLMTIPVLSVTSSVGQLLKSAAPSIHLDIETDTSIEVVKTLNVICVGRTGNASSTVLVGSHLDSVAAGPGINDNGSGSASTLEIQLTLARIGFKPHNRLVFAWWGAEEDGLLGSRHFARVLAHGWSNRWTADEPTGISWKDIALDLNFDMLASPNYISLVHNGTDAPDNARVGSQQIQRTFEAYFSRHKYPYQVTDMVAGSDFLPFIDNGVPAGGILTGAGELKSIDERREHGGLAQAPLDTCYHRDCDTLLNINIDALRRMSRAAMYAVHTLSAMPNLRGFLAGESQF
ncbi:hypothetical protein IW140_002240 [Coemansia sp. RSA 1813]|nr:hypothetical protein EV178_001749 [Coemansia sp. RSA 1646]KAJ1770524.1 hypothetical protein LPJ74_003128 [Coemansia sp. RSA 1843]KAJ2092938.1 hypothetical protein IW138_000651 [Coemansia sp. RSA 986]KAJ2216259.1 hypothetical protein EV179_001497 [Coemansia sp. RSA 487]KAJ2570568.1 hypothetical protein IW140_002240 [Coemansia sp. RSA 1813]